MKDNKPRRLIGFDKLKTAWENETSRANEEARIASELVAKNPGMSRTEALKAARATIDERDGIPVVAVNHPAESDFSR